MEEKIKIILLQEVSISLTEFCKVNRYSLSSVKRHFPEYCKEIIMINKQYKVKVRNLRESKKKNEIKNAVIELHQIGIYPSKKIVVEKLIQPAVFRNPLYRDHWRKVVVSLGYTLSH